MENHHLPRADEISKTVKRNKWSIGYVSVIVTIQLVVTIYSQVKGHG